MAPRRPPHHPRGNLSSWLRARQGVIRSFADRETAKLFAGTASRHLPPDIQRTARRRLLQFDTADRLDILRLPPGNQLEVLKGSRGNLSVVAVGSSFKIRLNGDEVLSVTDPTYTSGRVGLRIYSPGWKSLRRPLWGNATNPAWSEWAAPQPTKPRIWGLLPQTSIFGVSANETALKSASAPERSRDHCP